MKLDIDSQRLVDRLAEVAERQAQLAEEETVLKAELRVRLSPGVKYRDERGQERVLLRANRRFNPELAQQVLDPRVYASCLVPTLDAKKVKTMVAPAIYEQCQDLGNASVVLL